MDIYKEAIFNNVRVTTTKGNLSAEQLKDLGIDELDKLAVSLEEEYKKSNTKSFVVKKTAKDKLAKLKFDLVLDILTTKVEIRDNIQEAAAIKEHNQKILTLIAEKKDDDLKGKSISELEKMLK